MDTHNDPCPLPDYHPATLDCEGMPANHARRRVDADAFLSTYYARTDAVARQPRWLEWTRANQNAKEVAP